MVEDIKRILKEKGKVALDLNDGSEAHIVQVDGGLYESRMRGFNKRDQLDEIVDGVINHINSKYLVVRKIG